MAGNFGRSYLSAIGWRGAKSYSGNGVGRWVLSLLPEVVSGQTYVEPFAGMCGVLLNRDKASVEVACDLDPAVIAFWECMQEMPEELVERLRRTEYGLAVFNEAMESLESEQSTPLLRAWALCVVSNNSFLKMRGAWLRDETFRCGQRWSNWVVRLGEEQLWSRVADVNFVCRDAISLIEEISSEKDCVIYCDPPYESTAESYGVGVDQEKLFEVLKECRCQVALSGYPNSRYERLGWHRREKNILSSAVGATENARTEILWMNYEPPTLAAEFMQKSLLV